ncbi:MAG: zinc-ribbon domain-containing protein [bacterium]
MFCPKCGTPAPENAQFCMKCGHAMSGLASRPAQPTTSDTKANLLALLSFFIPGAGQFANRNMGKGILMLAGAVILALSTYPIAWFGVGLWSALEARGAANPEPKSSGGVNASKFATITFVLLICVVVLYNTFTGVTLESLDLTGIGKIKFSQKQNVVSEKEVEGMDKQVRTQREQELEGKLNEMQEQLKRIGAQSSHTTPGGDQAMLLMNVSGTWRNDTGASYVLQQSGDSVTLQEVSLIYGVPTTTAAGQGRIYGQVLELDCNTIMGVPGRLQLQLAAGGMSMSGSFTYVTGAAIPMTLYR